MNTKVFLISIISIFLSLSSVRSFSQDTLQDNKVYTVVENIPVYPGGDAALMEFLSDNIRYPDEAKTSGMTGTVIVRFIVEKDGSVTNAKILQGLGGGCNDEVLRVVKLMKQWTPGKQNGKTVRVLYNLPVKFSL
jgi:periplasmic protein TonB